MAISFKFILENINLVIFALEKILSAKDKIICRIEKRIFRKSVTVFVLSIIVVVFFLAISINTVFASTGRIGTTHCYPGNGETYQLIDHFTVQFSAVNTNTTVSVSIDGGAQAHVHRRPKSNDFPLAGSSRARA